MKNQENVTKKLKKNCKNRRKKENLTNREKFQKKLKRKKLRKENFKINERRKPRKN